MKNEDRIAYIDFLKVLSLTCIIIAHTNPPAAIHMIRNFDVPLMIILSSILTKRSYTSHYNSSIHFWSSRIKRLLIPTWIFLFIYFFVEYLLKGEGHTLDYYILSFCLTRYGVGYVWIVLIYIYSMLLIPLFSKYGESAKTKIAILLLYLLYEILCFVGLNTCNRFLETTFFYFVPYGLLTYIGCTYENFKEKNKKFLILISFLVFVLSGLYLYKTSGVFQNVQVAKYPPRFYYLSYGIFCSCLLLSLCRRKTLFFYSSKSILFVSKHSLWIYLWHVLFLMIIKHFEIFDQWYSKTLIIYFLSIASVNLINKGFDFIEKRLQITIPNYLR